MNLRVIRPVDENRGEQDAAVVNPAKLVWRNQLPSAVGIVFRNTARQEPAP